MLLKIFTEITRREGEGCGPLPLQNSRQHATRIDAAVTPGRCTVRSQLQYSVEKKKKKLTLHLSSLRSDQDAAYRTATAAAVWMEKNTPMIVQQTIGSK